jgi:hypothetical protein
LRAGWWRRPSEYDILPRLAGIKAHGESGDGELSRGQLELLYLMEASRSQLSLLWGEFFASGEEAPLDRVLHMGLPFADFLADLGGPNALQLALHMRDDAHPALKELLAPLGPSDPDAPQHDADLERARAHMDRASAGDARAADQQDRARRLQIARLALNSLLTGAREHQAVSRALCHALARDAPSFIPPPKKKNPPQTPTPSTLSRASHARLLLVPPILTIASMLSLADQGLSTTHTGTRA